jgi:hypothetical protein
VELIGEEVDHAHSLSFLEATLKGELEGSFF